MHTYTVLCVHVCLMKRRLNSVRHKMLEERQEGKSGVNERACDRGNTERQRRDDGESDSGRKDKKELGRKWVKGGRERDRGTERERGREGGKKMSQIPRPFNREQNQTELIM